MALCLCINPTGFGTGLCHFCGHEKDLHRRNAAGGPFPTACWAQVPEPATN